MRGVPSVSVVVRVVRRVDQEQRGRRSYAPLRRLTGQPSTTRAQPRGGGSVRWDQSGEI
jgi:hypothetical protein